MSDRMNMQDFLGIDLGFSKDTSLKAINPSVAKEWHVHKNNDLRPEHINFDADKKVWWQCKFGHEWEDTVFNRNKGASCPYCNDNNLCVENSLYNINKRLSKEWHPTKNGDLTPFDVLPNSPKVVWWQCKFGHDFQCSIRDRFENEVDCFLCAKIEKATKISPRKNGGLYYYWDVDANASASSNEIAQNKTPIYFKDDDVKWFKMLDEIKDSKITRPPQTKCRMS